MITEELTRNGVVLETATLIDGVVTWTSHRTGRVIRNKNVSMKFDRAESMSLLLYCMMTNDIRENGEDPEGWHTVTPAKN